jgi:hypothetical protein
MGYLQGHGLVIETAAEVASVQVAALALLAAPVPAH